MCRYQDYYLKAYGKKRRRIFINGAIDGNGSFVDSFGFGNDGFL